MLYKTERKIEIYLMYFLCHKYIYEYDNIIK